MNTIRSVWIGWGTLCVAGGTAYYLAKKSINADRAERQRSHQRKRVTDSLEYSASQQSPNRERRKASDQVGNPSSEATNDPAATRHAPSNANESVKEKSKYEASVPYRSPKGNRFS